jgi:hypothetical protein
MSLTNEELDKMQQELKSVFDKAVGWKNDWKSRPSDVTSADACKLIVETIQATMTVENEQRMRAEYNPRKTLQKD